jgi:type II secretory pathway component HofQ
MLMMTSGLIRTASSLRRQVLSVTALSAVLAIWVCSPAVVGAEIYTGEPITLDLVDADIKNVLVSLAEATGFTFAVDSQTVAEGGLDHLITVDYESIPWDHALDEILAASGLEWTLEGKVLWIHLPAYAPTGDRNFTGDAIKLRLEDADLRKVLATMDKVAGLTIDIDQDVEGTVSVNLKEIPWDQSLDLILRISGLDYAQAGDSIRVFKANDSKGLQLMAPPGI